jgi:hypothetical protein
VRLGVYDGATLDDPAGLLGGRGERHRQLVLTGSDDLERPELRDLLARAAARRREQLQPAD